MSSAATGSTLDVGAIAAIVVCGIVGIVGIVLLAVLLPRFQQQPEQLPQPQQQPLVMSVEEEQSVLYTIHVNAGHVKAQRPDWAVARHSGEAKLSVMVPPPLPPQRPPLVISTMQHVSTTITSLPPPRVPVTRTMPSMPPQAPLGQASDVVQPSPPPAAPRVGLTIDTPPVVTLPYPHTALTWRDVPTPTKNAAQSPSPSPTGSSATTSSDGGSTSQAGSGKTDVEEGSDGDIYTVGRDRATWTVRYTPTKGRGTAEAGAGDYAGGHGVLIHPYRAADGGAAFHRPRTQHIPPPPPPPPPYVVSPADGSAAAAAPRALAVPPHVVRADNVVRRPPWSYARHHALYPPTDAH